MMEMMKRKNSILAILLALVAVPVFGGEAEGKWTAEEVRDIVYKVNNAWQRNHGQERSLLRQAEVSAHFLTVLSQWRYAVPDPPKVLCRARRERCLSRRAFAR